MGIALCEMSYRLWSHLPMEMVNSKCSYPFLLWHSPNQKKYLTQHIIFPIHHSSKCTRNEGAGYEMDDSFIGGIHDVGVRVFDSS